MHRDTLSLSGPKGLVDKAESLLALHVDVPRPQVRLAIWTIQVNQRVDDFDGVADQLRTIDQGAQLERNLLREFHWYLTQSVRVLYRPSDQSKYSKFDEPAKFLWNRVGFSVNPNRPLTVPELSTFFCYADRDALRESFSSAKSIWVARLREKKVALQVDADGLSCAERNQRRKLSELLDAHIRQAESPEFLSRLFLAYGGYRQLNDSNTKVPTNGSLASQFAQGGGPLPELQGSAATDKNVKGFQESQQAEKNQLEAFLAAYVAVTDPGVAKEVWKDKEIANNGEGKLDTQYQQATQAATSTTANTTAAPFVPPALTPSRPFPRDLAKLSRGADTMLREAAEVFHDDLSNQFFEPYRIWVQGIAADSNELSVLGYTEVAATSGADTVANTSAQNFHPFTLRGFDAEGKPKSNQALQVAQSPNPLLEAAKILAEPEPKPTFVSIAPGINLSLSAQVLPGADSARLNITLHQSTKAEVDKELIEKGIAPVGMVDTSTLTTDVVIAANDLFELGTLGVQTTRIGEPAWTIPILRDIPLIGKFLFEGPPEPTTRQQNVLMLVDAQIVPRSIDYIRQ